MKTDVLIIMGSPRGKKGSSEAIADYLIKRIESTCTVTKILLKTEMNKPEKILACYERADHVIVSLPIYQNSVPGLVLSFFEFLEENKEKFSVRERRMTVISNSGFDQVSAHRCAVLQCQMFAKKMGMGWEGAVTVAPGTLIDGKELDKTGGTYAKLRKLLDTIAGHIETGKHICQEDYKLVSKPFMSPALYRMAGKVIKAGTIKKIGKEKYFQQPFAGIG